MLAYSKVIQLYPQSMVSGDDIRGMSPGSMISIDSYDPLKENIKTETQEVTSLKLALEDM